jgi:hypothetical protein
MRHGNPIAKALKFALPSAVEILLRFQASESRSPRERSTGSRKKKVVPAQARPNFMKCV